MKKTADYVTRKIAQLLVVKAVSKNQYQQIISEFRNIVYGSGNGNIGNGSIRAEFYPHWKDADFLSVLIALGENQ